jgi:hypothetical protein
MDDTAVNMTVSVDVLEPCLLTGAQLCETAAEKQIFG